MNQACVSSSLSVHPARTEPSSNLFRKFFTVCGGLVLVLIGLVFVMGWHVCEATVRFFSRNRNLLKAQLQSKSESMDLNLPHPPVTN